MKYLLTICIVFLFSYAGFTQESQPSEKEDAFTKMLPTDVASILENSCMQCHTSGSNSDKAKEKLNFSDWESYSVIKKIGKLKEVCEEATERKMPPEKYLAKFPEKKLSDDEIKLLCEWVKTESENLVNELKH